MALRKELRKKVESLLKSHFGRIPAPEVESISQIQDGIKDLDMAEKLNAQGTKLTGGIATAVRMKAQGSIDKEELATHASKVADVAQRAAAITGAMAGLSSAFQLIALGVRAVGKLADANHGLLQLPAILGETIGYYQVLIKCISDVLSQSMPLERILETNLVRVLVELMDSMGSIEDYLMQGKPRQVLNSKAVDDLKAQVEKLKSQLVVSC